MAQKIASNGSMLQNGKNVLIRTVTFFQVGRIERVTRSWVYLRDASWVGDTGRFGACLANGTFSEVEKIPGDGAIMVSRAAIVDMFAWNHALPNSTK